MSEKQLSLSDDEIEVEYQGETIEKFGLSYSDGSFKLTQTKTACLAEDSCGIAVPKVKVSLTSINTQDNGNTCTPGSGCCWFVRTHFVFTFGLIQIKLLYLTE